MDNTFDEISASTKVVVRYRWKLRGISMRVTRGGEIHVSAPMGVSRKTVVSFIEGHRDWLEKALARTKTSAERSAGFYAQLPLDTAAQRRDARNRLDGMVRAYVERYAPQMGVEPAGITYRAATSRWGSCNCRTRRLSFSYYLLLLPEWCVEHVVVHELAHLLVPNHGPEFHAVMDRFFPRWKEARMETRRISRN